MKDLLIAFDEAGYKSELSSLESVKNKYEKVISGFNSMQIGSLEKAEFRSLMFDTENFLFEKFMKDKPAEVNGMPVSKQKLFELFTKPANYYVLISEINELNAWLVQKGKTSDKTIFRYKNTLEIFNFYNFQLDGTVDVRAEIKTAAKSLFETYAPNSQVKDRFLLATKICELLNESGIFSEFRDYQNNKNNLNNLIDCIKVNGNCKIAASVDVDRIKYISV